MNKIICFIPGFRTQTPWSMVLAGVYYLFALSMMLVSVALGILLLSGPFLLFNGHTALEEYAKSKNARALVSLFLSAAVCGGGLIGFVADMSGRYEPTLMDTVMSTAVPHTMPAVTAVPSPVPESSPAPTTLERAIVPGLGEGACLNVQFADESAGEIRLAGIETGGGISPQAAAYMEEILPPGSIVYLEKNTETVSDPLAYYVWMDEFSLTDETTQKMLNALLVAKGLAAANTHASKYAVVFAACQEAAQAACVGLWAAAVETAADIPSPASAPTPTQNIEPPPSPAPAPTQNIEPTPAPVPESADPPPGGVYYCGSKNSDVFHLSTCGSAGQISPENLVIYSSREDAINKGKRPCKKCNP